VLKSDNFVSGSSKEALLRDMNEKKNACSVVLSSQHVKTETGEEAKLELPLFSISKKTQIHGRYIPATVCLSIFSDFDWKRDDTDSTMTTLDSDCSTSEEIWTEPAPKTQPKARSQPRPKTLLRSQPRPKALPVAPPVKKILAI